MNTLAAIGAIALILAVFLDIFETIILPRRVSRRLRLARVILLSTWAPLTIITRRIKNSSRREAILSMYGPLSFIFLLICWGVALIFSYGVIQWAMGSPLTSSVGPPSFGGDLYMSGSTFFTLGLGDIVPHTMLSRFVTILEAGTGLGVFALVIGYLPVLYQAFSRREVSISLLDARAGSPPTAVELLRRHCREDTGELISFLRDWERWSAELLESHISYPTLAYFRSQHEHQSWLAALTMVLDVCAIIMTGIDDIPRQQARLTFAIARHAAVDLSQVFYAPPTMATGDRLATFDIARVRQALADAGITLADGEESDKRLAEMRQKYEPYVDALSERLMLPLPAWFPVAEAQDDWQTSVWEHGERVAL